MNERQRQHAEKLYLTNLNIDWLINKYPLPQEVIEQHAKVDDLLSSLNVSVETRAVVRAAAVLGDLAYAPGDLVRPEVIPNTVRTIRGALELAQEMNIDVRLEINLALRYLDIANRSQENHINPSKSIDYLNHTLNPAIMYLGRARQILPNSPL